ncbi:MAG: MBL fold metallo-hydrolase, partial [Acidobacteriota bacterium]
MRGRPAVDLGRHRIAIFHPGPAHTRGDLIVRSLDESVLVTGDLFMRDACPSMGEGSVLKWVEILGMLEKTAPRHVVPGHFAPGTAADLRRFRDYLTAQIEQVRSGLARGRDPGEIAAAVDLPAFSSFREFPQYGATFADNARTIAREIASRPAPRGRIAGFTLRATIDAGRNPHQIAFSPDGGKAYVAAAGSDRVTVIDARTYRVVGSLDTTPTPLGVAVGTGGAHLLVSLFGADAVVRYDIESKEETGRLVTGGAPSLLVGPNPDGTYLVSSEKADRLWVLDAKPFSLRRSYPTGKRPFPPAATSDGRLAFVPGYDDGTVTIVDLWN